MRPSVTPTGTERVLHTKEIIVSKTDLTGKITYANKQFLEISGYSEDEVLGVQHNCIRHPDMPRSIFQFLWDRLKSGNEVFAYVINLCKEGDHYWVLAHVTPSMDESGNVLGYHSNRRAVNPEVVKNVIAPVYAQLKQVENAASSPKQGLADSMEVLKAFIAEKGGNYDRWIFSL
ncbi:PAS domain-containing protein [Sneathiella limimaris]|uniref:PAS domain-containing protein n=1 Tax=Sneathiella limimaris TaxID=1964213 RepID=UPI0019D2E417|nr:PAS domain-containing protein [Sneathiella limimaris]